MLVIKSISFLKSLELCQTSRTKMPICITQHHTYGVENPIQLGMAMDQVKLVTGSIRRGFGHGFVESFIL